MAFVIEITSEDDFADILSKLQITGIEREVIMRVDKDALLFSELQNLVELKKRTDAAKKIILIETVDHAGAILSRQAGYQVNLYLPTPAAVPEQPVRSVEQETWFEPQPEAEPEPQRYIPEPSVGRFRKATNRTLFAVFSLAMIVLLLLAFVILPQANITVYAKTEELTRDMQVTVDTTATTVDPQQLVIPGTNLSTQQVYSQAFQSTGGAQGGQNASGTVQIYNFSGHVLKLGGSTTTLTAGSETYHFSGSSVIVPITKYYSGSKTDVDPSSLGSPVTVVANQPGSASNLPAGTRIEIKNAVFGSNPAELYATSYSSITAPDTSSPQSVSQTDISSATAALQKQVLAASEQQLLTSRQLTLLDSAASLTNTNVSFDQPVNAQAASFDGTIKTTVNGLAFNKSDLVKLVEQRIAITLDPGMYLVTDQNSGYAETITENFSSYAPGGTTGILLVHVAGIIASNVDTSGFAQQFKGQSIQQIQAILAQNQAVQGADISLAPFWVRTAPRFLNKIYITTEIKPPQDQEVNTGD